MTLIVVILAILGVVAGESCSGLENNIDYEGNDVMKYHGGVESVDACCDLCFANHNLSARYFTYEASSQSCYVKSSNAGRKDQSGSLSGSCGSGPAGPVQARVTFSPDLVSTTGPFFASFNIDSSYDRGFWSRNLSNPIYGRVARHLSPSILRFGGTGNDYVCYKVGNASCVAGAGKPVTTSPQCLNTTWLGNLLSFADSSSANLVFGLNLFPEKACNVQVGEKSRENGVLGAWDGTNAEQLLRYLISQDFALYGLELGNEQNSFGASAQCAAFQTLSTLVSTLYPASSSLPRPLLFGPDPHSFHGSGGDGSGLEFLGAFAKCAGGVLEAVTHHEYIEVDASNALDPAYLDRTDIVAREVVKTVRENDATVHIVAGELGDHNNGGVPGVSNTFLAVPWWTDVLGTKAKRGYWAVFRQDFVGASYGLVSDAFLEEERRMGGVPTTNVTIAPDFFISMAHKQLIGQGVLNATVAPSSAFPPGAVRTYAHCAKRDNASLALFTINLAPNPVILEHPYANTSFDAYLFNATSTTSTTLLLNNSPLPSSVSSSQDLPSTLTPVKIPASQAPTFQIPPLSVLFAIYDTKAPQCIT